MYKFKPIRTHNSIKIVLAIWLTLILIYRITICFSYLPELSNGESNNIWKAINVANGKPMYTDPENLPLEVFQYTPLSQFPIIGIAKLLDSNSTDYLYFVTALGRLYELIANISLIILLYYIAKIHLKTSKLTASLIALTCLSLLTFPAFTIRPDATLLFLLAVSVWSYFTMEENNSTYWIITTSLILVACFYTKQDGILIAGPMALRLILLKKWKNLITLGSLTIGLLSLAISLSPLLFGPHFYTCVLKGLKNTSTLTQSIAVFDRAYGFYAFHFVMGLIVSIYFLVKRPNEKITFIAILSIFYFFVALATSSKSGSWVNYYTPYILFASCVIFYFLAQVSHDKKKLHPFFHVAIAILLSVLFLLKQVYVYTSPFINHTNGKKEYYNAYLNVKRLKTKLNIQKKDNILILNQLNRNFLAQNSIMINTEYYNYASYTYTAFKKKKKKEIKYIIYQEKEKPSIDYLIQFFNVSKANYKKISNPNFTILKLK